MPTEMVYYTRRIDPRLRAAWDAWYRSRGKSSRFKIEHLAALKARKGKWPPPGYPQGRPRL